jgi:hypothetical protein
MLQRLGTPVTEKLWYEKAGGRKFLLCSAFGIVFCLMLVTDVLSEAAFERLMAGTVVAFILGNVGQKALAKQAAP